MTNRKFLSLLLALFMVLSTFTPLFAENDSVTVLPPRMADETKEPEDNIVVMNGDREEKEETKDSPIILENNRDESNVEEKEAEKDAPLILENRDDNNVTILPPITNEEKTTEPEPKEEPKKHEEQSKSPVEVQVLSKRETTEGDKKEEGKVSLVLLNDKPASVNEEVYSKIKWIKDDFSIDNDKILGLSEEGLKKVKANKKLVIPEMDNITTIEKQAFMNLGLRVVEIPGNITLIEEEAFKGNGLTKVVINGKGKTIAGSAFGEELLNEYKRNEEEVFLYEFEGLQIGQEIIPDAVGAGEPDDLNFFTFNGTTITGLSPEGEKYYNENHTMVLPGVNPEGKKFTEIKDWVFQYKELQKVDFSNMDGLVEICNGAFSDNNLVELNLSGLKNLKRIGESSFTSNSSLENVNLSNCESLEFIDYGAFSECKIKRIDFSNCINLKAIKDFTFNSNKIESIDLTDSKKLELIDEGAFYDNPGMEKYGGHVVIYVDKSIEDNFTGEFLVNPLEPIDEPLTEDDFIYSEAHNSECSLLGLSKTGYAKVFANKSLVFPSNSYKGVPITQINDYAFASLRIENLDLSNLTDLKSISNKAFSDNNLTVVNIPESLEIIHPNAFDDNPGSEKANGRVILKTPKGMGLDKISNNEHFIIDLIEKSNDLRFYTFSFIGDYITGLSSEGEKFFKEHDEMVLPRFNPQGVPITGIADNAFYRDLPSGGHESLNVKKIDFSNCASLKYIGEMAFRYSEITSLDLSMCKNLETIADVAFQYSNIETLNLSNLPNLATIGQGAFNDNRFTDINLSNCTGLKTIGYKAFDCSYSDLYKEEKYRKLNLSNCSSLEYIKNDAFCGLYLNELDIAGCKNLKEVGLYSFAYNKLSTMDLTDSKNLESIGTNAFERNPGVQEYAGKVVVYVDDSLANKIPSGLSFLINPNPTTDKKLTEDDFAYKLNANNTYTLLGLTSSGIQKLFNNDYILNIDFNSYKGIPITSIGSIAFLKRKIKKLDLTGLSYLEKIERAAFERCQLEEVDLSGLKNLKVIDENAFYDNKISNLNLSGLSGLYKIDKNAFANNNLTKIDFSDLTNLEVIVDNAFSRNKLESVDFSMMKKLRLLSGFNSNQINKINISGLNNLEEIRDSAFSYNKLTSLDFSGCESLEFIAGSFSNNQLSHIDFSDCVNLKAIYKWAFSSNKLTKVDLSKCVNLKKIGDSAFSDNNIKVSKIPLSVNDLHSDTFYNNPGHNDKKQVLIFTSNNQNPNYLRDSRYHVFAKNINAYDENLYTFDGFTLTGLTELGELYYSVNHDMVLPREYSKRHAMGASIYFIHEIANGAFKNKNLESVDFSKVKHLETIGLEAFKDNNIKTINLDTTTVKTIKTLAFANNELTKLNVPGTLRNLTYDAFKGNSGSNLNKQVYLYTPDRINEGELEDSEYHLIDPKDDDVSDYVGYYTFEGTVLTGLSDKGKEYFKTQKEMLLPAKNSQGQEITEIGERAFAGLGLTNVIFKNIKGLQVINASAFTENALTNLDLEGLANLKSIGSSAFSNNKIEEIRFKDNRNIESIGAMVFSSNELKVIDLSSLEKFKSIEDKAFDSNKILTAYVPLSLSLLSDTAFTNNLGYNNSKKVYVLTPNQENPNGLKDSNYHLINPNISGQSIALFKFDGNTLVGISEAGKKYLKENPDTEVLIPRYTDTNKPVEIIAKNAFKELNLTLTLEANPKLKVIEEYAFFKNKVKAFNGKDFPELTNVGDYAFAHNEIKDFTLSDKIETIGKYAFRDNKIEKVDIKTAKSILEGAFSNNLITDLTIGDNITELGNYAFKQNNLSLVTIPADINSFGKMVFAFNNRYVRVLTDSNIIKSEMNGRAYGHVLNAVTVIVRSIDKETGKRLIEDKIIGNDFTDINGIFAKNEENNYIPEKIKGYAVEEVIKFTPDSDKYILVIEYKSTKIPPVIKFTNNKMFQLNEPLTEEILKSLVTVTDVTGKDIRDKVEVEPNTIDTSIGGMKKVTYKVTDEYGNTTIEEFEIPVAINWNDYPIGGGWVLGDFTYSGYYYNNNYDKVFYGVNGLSSSGLKKIKTNKNLVLPGVVPKADVISYDELPKVHSISYNYNSSEFSGRNLISVDFSNCKDIKFIGSGIFKDNLIKSINLSGCENLDYIGVDAFRSNKLASIDLSDCTNLTSIKKSAFMYNNINEINFENCLNLTTIEDGAFNNNKLTNLDLSNCKNLKTIGKEAFLGNNIETIDFSNCINLEVINHKAFASNNIKSINLTDSKNLSILGGDLVGRNPGNPEYYNLVDIWVDKTIVNRFPSRFNYVINPTAIMKEPFNENDFFYESSSILANGKPGYMISGFTNTGKLKLAEHDYDLTIGFSTYKGEPITYISGDAFVENNIKSVNLSGLEYLYGINERAFNNNKIVSLDLSKCINLKSIEANAFTGNQITSVDFKECKNLENIGASAFQGNKIENVDLSDCVNLKTIWSYAFKNNLISDINLSACINLESIYDYSFSSNKISKLDLSKCTNLKTIKDNAFADNEIREINFYGCENLKTIEYGAFKNNKIINLDLSNCQSLESIGDSSFSNNKLINVDLSNCINLKSIENSAFVQNEIKLVDFSNCISLEDIGERAFTHNQLTNLNLSGCTNLTSIGERAFTRNQLISLDLSGCTSLATIGDNAFEGNKLISLNLSGCTNLTNIEYDAFKNNQLASLNLSGCIKLKRIGNNAFYSNNLTNLDLSGCTRLTSIGKEAFKFNQLANLDLSECTSLESIGGSAFNSNNLVSLDFFSCVSLKNINDYAFYGNQITNLNLSGCTSLESISSSAFENNLISSIEFVNLNNLQEISSDAFKNNKIKDIKFEGCNKLYVIYEEAFANNNIVSVVFSNCQYFSSINGITALNLRDNTFINNPGNPKWGNLVDIWVDTDGVTKVASRGNYIVNPKEATTSITEFIQEDFIYLLKEDGSYSIEGLAESGKLKLVKNNYELRINFNSYNNKPISAIGFGAFEESNIKKLDLSNCSNLKIIRTNAFKNNKIESVNFSNCSNLYDIQGHAFRYNKIQHIDLSTCENLKLLGEECFDDNNVKYIKIPASLSSIKPEVFYFRSYRGQEFSPVYVFTPNSENPQNLKNDREIIIDPLFLSIKCITEDGTILKTEEGLVKDKNERVSVPMIFGYRPTKVKETNEEIKTNDFLLTYNEKGIQEITIIYEKAKDEIVDGVELSVEMTMSNNTDPYNYYISSEQRLNVRLNVKADISNVENSVILLELPPYIDTDSIKIPAHSNIKSKEIEDNKLKINLQNITRNTSIDIPVLFSLKKYVTPENTEMTIKASAYDGFGGTIHTGVETSFKGFYYKPKFYVTAATTEGYKNYYRWQDGPREAGDVSEGMFEDKSKKMVVTPRAMEFGFLLSNGKYDSLERNIEKYSITLDLPRYTAYDDKGNEVIKTAVFKQELNKDWKLEGEKLIFMHEGDMSNLSLSSLYLSFPNAKDMGEVKLLGKIVMTPQGKSETESLLEITDDLTIQTTGKKVIYVEPSEPGEYRDYTKLFLYVSNVRSNRYVNDFIYDIKADREKVVRWVAGFEKDSEQKDYTNLVMTIDNLDQRYKITSIQNKVDTKLKYKLYLKGGLKEEFNLYNLDDIKELSGEYDKIEIIPQQKLNQSLKFYINTLALNPDESLGKDNVSMAMTGNTTSTFERDNSTTKYNLKAGDYYKIIPFDYKLNANIEQSISSKKAIVSGDTVSYKLGLVDYVAGVSLNNGEFFTKDLDNFVMVHMLPKNALITNIKLSDGFRNSDEAEYEVVSLDDGRSAIVFKAKSLQKGTYNIADVSIYTSSGMNEGVHPSSVYATWIGDGAEKYKIETIPENLKPYLSGDVTKDSAEFSLVAVKVTFSEKYIKTKDGFVLNSETRDGNIDYILKVVNNTETERNNLEIIDILPYNGDSRGSEIDVTLREAVQVTGGEVLYTTVEKPAFDSNFTSTYSDNVTGLKIRIPKLGKNETVQIEVKAKLKNIPTTKEEILSVVNKKAVNDFWRTDDISTTPVKTNPVETIYRAPLGIIRFTKYGLKKSWFSSNYKKVPLEGALFELRDKDGFFIGKATSDKNGIVEFKDVEVGNYILKEIEAPKGYEKAEDFIVSKEDFNLVENSFIAEINKDVINETVRKGNLTIKKTTENGTVLPNVKFNIKGTNDFNSNYEKTVTTNKNGEIYVANIPEGDYVVTEIEKDKDLKRFIPAHPQTFRIEQSAGDEFSENQEVSLNFINNRIKFRLNKIGYNEDEEFPLNLADTKTFNRPKLPNIEFTVTIDGEEKVYTTNEDGYVEIEAPTNKTIKIKETKCDPRYKVYDKEISLTIDDNGNIEGFEKGIVNVPNIRKKIRGEIKINKVDGEGNPLHGEETVLMKENMETERKTSADSETVYEVTDSGVYSVIESKAPLGYAKTDEKFDFVVKRNDNDLTFIEPNSEEYSNTIAKDEYEFYTFNDEEVKFMKKIKVVNKKLIVNAKKYELILANVTKEDVSNYENNPKYAVVPNGEFYNVVKPLEGAEFDLYEKIKARRYVDQNGNKVVEPARVEKLKSLVSDKDGNLDLSGIVWNEEHIYSLKETKVPSSEYKLREDEVLIDFSLSKNRTSFDGTVNVGIENTLHKGKIIISKYENLDTTVLQGQEFTLYKDSVSEENKMATKVTDKSGLLEFNDLDFGHYVVKETASNEEWKMNDKEYISDIDRDHLVSVHKIFNDPSDINFTIQKLDANNKPMKGVVFALYRVNEKKVNKGGFVMPDLNINGPNTKPSVPEPTRPGYISGTKMDVSGSDVDVSGPKVDIDGPDIDINPPIIEDDPKVRYPFGPWPSPEETLENEPIFITATTDKNGIAEVIVPYARYFLVEYQTLDGYSINPTIEKIDKFSRGKTFVYKDYKVEVKVPKTGTLGVVPYIAIGLLLVAGAYIVLKKKEEARD